MTQKQLESLRVLSMNMQELGRFLEREAESNPVLEYAPGEMARSVQYASELADELENVPADNDATAEDILLSQIDMRRYTREEEAVFRAITQMVDDDGYLAVPAPSIPEYLHISRELADSCLGAMKKLEPRGVCSSSLAECLESQLTAAGMDDELTLRIVRGHLEQVADRKIAEISKALGAPTAEIRRSIAAIGKLEPRPLRGMLGKAAQYVVPDVLLRFDGNRWEAEMNDGWYETLGASDYYSRLLSASTDTALREYLAEKLKRVETIREAVSRRRETLLAIALLLAERQSAFLRHGGALAPLTMTELGTELGLHISVLSRALKGKYLRHPRGICEMRALFVQGTESRDGGKKLSRNEIKAAIEDIVTAEKPDTLLSDREITAILGERGIEISRRTVAKYRNELNIRGTYDRKHG